MRILLAAKTMGVGGLERIVVALARELKRRGHDVWVVSSGGELVPALDRAGATHVLAPLEITSPIGLTTSAQTIRRLIEDQRIDLVHSFSATASVAVNLALRVTDGRVRLVSSPMGLQNVVRELPRTRFLIVGEGELRAELDEQVRTTGLEGKVVLTGVCDDVARILSA